MRHKYLVVHSCDGTRSEIPFSTFKSARAEFMWKDREMKVKSYLWVDDRLRARWVRERAKHPSWFDIKE